MSKSRIGKNKSRKSKNDCSKYIHHIFERGDVISNSSGEDMRVILKAENRMYYFLNLKTQNIKGVSAEPLDSKKGSKASQPADIVEKYFYLVELR